MTEHEKTKSQIQFEEYQKEMFRRVSAELLHAKSKDKAIEIEATIVEIEGKKLLE